MVGVTLKVLYNDDMSEEFQKSLNFLVDQKYGHSKFIIFYFFLKPLNVEWGNDDDRAVI